MTFEEKLRREIELQYGSLYHFAQVIGVSRSVFTGLKNAGIESLSEKTVKKIARGLSFDPESLMRKEFVYVSNVPLEEIEAEAEVIKQAKANRILSPLEETLLTAFQDLSVKGQFKVLDYIEDISAKYKKD